MCLCSGAPAAAAAAADGVGAVCCTYRTYNLVAAETSQRKHEIMGPPQNAYTKY